MRRRKISKFFSIILTLSFLVSPFPFPQNVFASVTAKETMYGDRSATAVTDNWIAPPGVSSVKVEAWGGGGTGGSATGNNSRAGGGAGGQYAFDSNISVTGGNSYAVTIASTPAASSNGVVNGQDTQWVGCATQDTHVCAKGGTGGPNNTTANSTTSGTASGSTASGIGGTGEGTTVFAGGNSGAGNGTASGGGGGGAGTTGAGGAASGQTAGTGTSVGGGDGGTGVTTTNTSNPGSWAGGGGSGGFANNATNRAGGIGGTGRMDFTYSIGDDYPAIVEVVRGRDSGNSTTHTITMPTSITAGDLILVVFGSDATSSTNSSVNTGVSGNNWVELKDSRDSTNVVQSAIYYKFAEGSDVLQIDTADTQEASWIVYQIRNAGTPEAGTTANGNSTNANPPTLTPSYGSLNYLFIATTVMDATSISTSFPTDSPSNYSSLITSTAATTGGAHTGASRRYLTATNDDPGTFTNATEQWVSNTVAIPPISTILGDGTDGSSSTIAPGASATEIDRFSLQATKADTVTGMTVTLAPSGAFNNLATVGVYTTGDVLKCSSSSWGGDLTVELTSCGISVTTSSTEYVVKVTPKSHANMPAVPGASYATTATVTSITATNSTAGTDTDSATITVDNASPSAVTSSTASAGDTVVDLAWTNPGDSDFTTGGTVVVLRRASSAITQVPVEGTTYSVGNTIGGVDTVACVVTGSPPTTSCQDTGLSNGTAYHYKIFTQDSRGNYDAGTVPTGSPATPASSSFSHYRPIVIDHTKVPNTDQTDFPILVSGTYSYLATVANGGDVQNASGYDIGFYSDSGLTTKLKWETEKYTASTGEVIYWVKIPTLSHTADTTIYMAYGNAGISTDQSDPVNTWNSSYAGVWHLDESSGAIYDSTSNNNDTSDIAGAPVYSSTGKFGTAFNFDGVDDYWVINNSASLQNVQEDNYTISAWAMPETVPPSTNNNNDNYGILMKKGYHEGLRYRPQYFGFDHWASDNSWLGVDGDTDGHAPGDWYYVVGVMDKSAGTTKIYLNGNLDGTWSWTPDTATREYDTMQWRIGTGGTNGDGSYEFKFDGTIDEVRISSNAKSGDWVATEYNNQTSPSTFYSIGTDVLATVTPTVNHFRWFLDNGPEGSATPLTTEDTNGTIGTGIGDRRRLRFVVTGPATSVTYKLEHSSSSCSVWLAVPTLESNNVHFVTDYTTYLTNDGVTTDSGYLTNPNGKTFVAGRSMTISNTTSEIRLSSSQFTEIEYSLRSTSYVTSGVDYCFRVTNAGSATGFTYSVSPILNIPTTFIRPETGGQVIEVGGVGTLRTGGNNVGGGTTSGGIESGGSGQQQGGGGSGGGGSVEGAFSSVDDEIFNILIKFNEVLGDLSQTLKFRYK